jgi:hypothetical protein
VHNVVVAERSAELCLAVEAGHKLRVVHQVLVDDLERHRAVQVFLHRPVNRGHAAAAHHFVQLVAVAQCLANQGLRVGDGGGAGGGSIGKHRAAKAAFDGSGLYFFTAEWAEFGIVFCHR